MRTPRPYRPTVTPQAAADAATTHLLGGQLDAPASQLLLALGTSLGTSLGTRLGTRGGDGTDGGAGGAQSGGAVQQGAGTELGERTERLRRAARGAQREAVRAYRTALALRPAYPEAYRNLGSVLKERRATHSAAVRAHPDHCTQTTAPGARHRERAPSAPVHRLGCRAPSALRPLPAPPSRPPPPCTIDASSRELSAESNHQWTARSRSHPASLSSASPPAGARLPGGDAPRAHRPRLAAQPG